MRERMKLCAYFRENLKIYTEHRQASVSHVDSNWLEKSDGKEGLPMDRPSASRDRVYLKVGWLVVAFCLLARAPALPMTFSH